MPVKSADDRLGLTYKGIEMTEAVLTRKSKALIEKEKLLATYENESLLNKRILQIKALIFYMQNKGDFVRGISGSELRAPNGHKFNVSNLNPRLQQLKKSKLLDSDYNCNRVVLHEITMLALEDPENARTNLSILSLFFNYKSDYNFFLDRSLENIRIVHVTVHLNDPRIFLSKNLVKPGNFLKLLNDLIYAFYGHSLDPKWVKNRHPLIQLYLICAKLYGFYSNIQSFPPDLNYWVGFIRENDWVGIANKQKLNKFPVIMNRILQLSFAFKGLPYIAQLPKMAEQDYYQYETEGLLAFFKDEKVTAIQNYEKANKLFKSLQDKQEWFRGNLHAIFYILALLNKSFSAADYKKAESAIVSLKKTRIHDAVPSILAALLSLKSNDREKAVHLYNTAQRAVNFSATVFPFLQALIDWCAVLLEPEKLPGFSKQYQEKFEFFRNISHHFIAQMYAEFIQAANPDNAEVRHFLEQVGQVSALRFMDIIHVKQPWEYAINQLENILTEKKATAGQQDFAANRRMIWMIDPISLEIDVAEQTLRKNGTWSVVKPIALRRIFNNLDQKLDYLTPQDQAAIAGLRCELYGFYNSQEFFWDKQHTLNALIGHPLIFHSQNHDIPLELVKGTVELQVEKTDNGYHFSLSEYSDEPRVFLKKEATNRYRVIEISDETVEICKILSQKGMTVPMEAKDRVIDIICNAKSSIHIHSDIADDDLPIRPGDTTVCAHLFPLQGGLKVNLWIRPLGDQGSYYRASQGQRSIITAIKTAEGEERIKIIRDFPREKLCVDSLINNSRVLAEFDEKTDEWYITTLENSLELLLELDEYHKNTPIRIEWPKGQTLKVKQPISSKNLSLSVKGNQYWFEYEGEVSIDEHQALDIKKLLDLLDQSQGRFIPLATGEFVALTERFRKQLEDLRMTSDGNKIYHLSTSSLRELANDAKTLQEDETWTAHIKKLTAMEKHQPVIPSTLQAELRDYQKDGFSYLSRLAHWEIGACLADDMGLGKTIQAIALLLTHAPKGPCLVVAPTSVCFVWVEELAKFAPTLVAHKLHNVSDRKGLIDSLGKMDILICSYGLLHQIGEMLLDKPWQMIILDEAQAIKNSDTKRWRYATQLNSKCRVALTGTPIENHLGELWSIFRFLNPGLLGSLASFQHRFSGPIEKYNDPVAKRALKNVVSPYILRRTKSEVLQELPPKIEQSVLIEPTVEEMAFYEAVRVKALERIGQLNQAEDKNTKRFSILAEISRLRQACCHANLVDENIGIPSSKVKSFLTLAKNIIDNKHKALVFSQFVRYLEIIKQVLDQEKISYQYLDGSTPLKERQRLVEDFQSGIGDLFLISLKAGGTGLNLTAADYVIILDPWWNPAVEDQAADRAHRMGQLRPVTVYRLIMKNSIEEKIVTLHKNKKDLAADLLSGSDLKGKFSEEELVGLITG